MTKTWFTADTHFGHSNIIKYCKRPFRNVDVMDAVLVNNWNSRIKPHDIVIFLGDFAYKDKKKVTEYLEALHGHITFIKGNHDNNNSLETRIIDLVVEMNGKKFYCVHDPANCNLRYKYNLVGHVHDKWKIKRKQKTILINVGVDVWNFAPVNISEILKLLKNDLKKRKRK